MRVSHGTRELRMGYTGLYIANAMHQAAWEAMAEL
jgi:hypothetical protein